MARRRTRAAPSPVEQAWIVSTTVSRAAAILGLPNTALARILGLSEATISRLKSGTYTLDPQSKPYELALLLIRLFRGVDSITGGDDTATRSWLRSENRALRGVPAELIESVPGLVGTVSYVDSERARV